MDLDKNLPAYDRLNDEVACDPTSERPPHYSVPLQPCYAPPAQQQMLMPSQSHHSNTTVIAAPVSQTMTVTQHVPDDHMALAIFVTICCCWPIGLFAILKARDVHKKAWQGDMAGSAESSRSARQLSLIALGVGIGCILLSIIIPLAIVFSAAAAAENDVSQVNP